MRERELEFKDFNFKAHVSELLHSTKSKKETISPLFNLFNKNLGDIYERYKQNESVFELIHERLSNDPAADLKDQLSNSTKRNKQLESELKATKIELNKLQSERNKSKVVLAKKRKVISDHESDSDKSTSQQAMTEGVPGVISKPIDTRKLAETVKTLLKTHDLAVGTLARRVVGIESDSLTRMLINPLPWSNNDEYLQSLWQKLDKWSSQSVEAIQSLKVKLPPRGHSSKAKFQDNFKLLPVVPPNTKLDTAKVAQTIKDILIKNCLTLILVSKELHLGCERDCGKLLKNPTPWYKCTEYRKKLYFRMHQWSQSADEIQSLEAIRDSTNIRKFSVASYKSLPEVPSDLELDTAKIARTVKEILKKESITYDLFSKEVVLIHEKVLCEILNSPILWTKCTEYKKRVFLRMHQWSQSREEIESLADF